MKPLILITGKNADLIKRLVSILLNNNEISYLGYLEDFEIKRFQEFITSSPFSLLIINNTVDIPVDKDYCVGDKEKLKKTIEILNILPSTFYLVLNYDDKSVRKIRSFTTLKTITFGFSKESDVFVSDYKLNGGANFKVNYEGKVVPFWLENINSKQQIYGVLAAISVCLLFGKNLVEISQIMRNYTIL